jgi:hypothetical protein
MLWHLLTLSRLSGISARVDVADRTWRAEREWFPAIGLVDDSDAVIDLINELEPGERVRIVADEAIASDGGFVRSDRTLIDDTATVVEEDEYGTELELDETVIQYHDETHEATNVDVQGEQVVANWVRVDDGDDMRIGSVTAGLLTAPSRC